jgi:hypothetical protein
MSKVHYVSISIRESITTQLVTPENNTSNHNSEGKKYSKIRTILEPKKYQNHQVLL